MSYPIFNVVKAVGRPEKATFKHSGGEYTVERATLFYFNDRFEQCEDYDDHFLFRTPGGLMGPVYQCTCGSIAGLVIEIPGQVILRKFYCIFHLTYGKHTNSGGREV